MSYIYLVSEVEITDPAVFATYLPLSAASVELYGGEYLARGGDIETWEGPPVKRMVITRFPSADAVRRWYGSPEYAEAKALRLASSDTRMVMIPGLE
jgi:uncharacterized protein (DUF1330 family)